MSCTLLLSVQMSYCQIGIGTTRPDRSSILDVTSSDKGFLLPRMSTLQRDAIVKPAEGLIIYNLDEGCIQINSGSSSSPDWACIGTSSSAPSSSATVVNNCDANGFEGTYVHGYALTETNKFSVTINNNSFNSSTIDFTTADLVLSGVGGISVNSVSPSSATIEPGGSQVVEYSLTGTPDSLGAITGVWTKLGLNCTKTVDMVNGDATFALPHTFFKLSTYGGSPLVDIQGIIDNGVNQFTITLPYIGGVGSYEAFSGTYYPNNAGTAEGNDANSFRLSYPSGIFSPSGSITATIEVDGDGSFNVKKQLFGIQETIVSLDFKVNGHSKGTVHLDVIGGIPDRNFAEANHKFIYMPVTAADGNTWLNNNLGADYSNLNHMECDPTQQAIAYDDHFAYGSLFQWGRYSDGHELINYISSTSAIPVNGVSPNNTSNTDTPNHNLFINDTDATDSTSDWRIPHNDNLWQGVSGINNPCPNGYRIPTRPEMDTLMSAEGITGRVTAASSPLRFTTTGVRNTYDGVVYGTGVSARYWTSTIVDPDQVLNHAPSAYTRYFNTWTIYNTDNRGYGNVVRCIKD